MISEKDVADLVDNILTRPAMWGATPQGTEGSLFVALLFLASLRFDVSIYASIQIVHGQMDGVVGALKDGKYDSVSLCCDLSDPSGVSFEALSIRGREVFARIQQLQSIGTQSE